LNEPFVEHDGELGFYLEPLARRHFPLARGIAQDEKQKLCCGVIGWKMPPRAHGAAQLCVERLNGVRGVDDPPNGLREGEGLWCKPSESMQ
jgi:hypothetical protein